MKHNALKVLAVAAAASMCLGLAACNNDSSSGSSTSGSGSTAETLSGKVNVGGSTSMEAVVEALREAFAEEYPDVDVTYSPTGSGAGITGATDGTLDIGLSSRALKEEETDVKGTTIALDGISIIVNANNPVSDLSLDDLAKIATGEITNWSELGGNDAPIVFLGREAGSGTRDGFESIVGVEDVCVYNEELTTTGAVIAKVQSNESAIGYASLSAVDDSVKTLTIEGVAPSEETVQDGTYKIQRPFVLVTNESNALSDAAQAFFDFATSDAADDLIRAAGAVPLAD